MQRFHVGSIGHYYTVYFTIVAEVCVFERHPSVRYENSPFQLFNYYANLNTSRELVHESTCDFTIFILNPLECLSSCTRTLLPLRSQRSSTRTWYVMGFSVWRRDVRDRTKVTGALMAMGNGKRHSRSFCIEGGQCFRLSCSSFPFSLCFVFCFSNLPSPIQTCLPLLL